MSNKKPFDYEKLSRQELIERIMTLEELMEQIYKEKENIEQREFAWSGNLGRWFWNVADNKVVCNPLKLNALGYREDEIPENVSYQFFTDMLHPDDFASVMEDMRSHLYGKKDAYEAEYRIKAQDGNWLWFYDRGIVSKRDLAGKPLEVAGIVFNISERKNL